MTLLVILMRILEGGAAALCANLLTSSIPAGAGGAVMVGILGAVIVILLGISQKLS